MPAQTGTIAQSVSRYIEKIDKVLTEIQLDSRVSPEDQLKKPVADFIEEVSHVCGQVIRTSTEHRQVAGDSVEGVRLDIAIKKEAGPLIGHVELKSPSKSANPIKKAGWSKQIGRAHV